MKFNIIIIIHIVICNQCNVIIIIIIEYSKQTSDVNDAEPRLLIINAEPRIPFSEKN